MLIASLIASAVLLVITNALAWRKRTWGYGWAIVIWLLAFFGGWLVAPAFALNALLIIVVGGVWLFFSTKPFIFLKASLAATAVWFMIVLVYGIYDVSKWAAYRDQYPMQSLEDRLAYEKSKPHHIARDQRESSTETDQELLEHLAAVENQFDRGSFKSRFFSPKRITSLKHLHSSYVSMFVNSEGFGVGRIIGRPTIGSLEVQDEGPMRLTDSALTYSDEFATNDFVSALASPLSSLKNRSDGWAFLQMHDDNVLDFAYPAGFGYFKDIRHVAGFESHRFRENIAFSTPDNWKLDRLELVSLLKHETPAVYLSEYLPRMQDLSDAKTGPLDAFETAALKALVEGEDLKVWETTDQMRMLGSLRAAKQCLNCHSVERGDLLGAFTYRLRRAKP